MTGRAHPALSLLALLAACGGGAGAGGGGAGPGAGDVAGVLPPGSASPPGVTAPPSPPGAAAPSATSGSATLQIGAAAGLFYADHPLPGEPYVSGLVIVVDGQATPPRDPPPADTVLTLNGVPLARAVLGGVTSDRWFTVDPGGPQPIIAPDGFLHLVASSASTGARRVLDLACPADLAVTSAPAAGASLAGAAALTLGWTPALPENAPSTVQAFGLAPPQLDLFSFDPATHAVGAGLAGQPVAPGALGASLAVSPTPGAAYLLELRYPGLIFVDGETGGVCGRIKRFVYAK